MTFTFTSDLTVPIDFVRFWVGDDISAESLLSDALITSMITVEGSKEKAVIAGIQYKIMKMSQPDFSADWLSENSSAALASLEKRLNDMRAKFGIAARTAVGLTTYRADSQLTEPPDYTEGV